MILPKKVFNNPVIKYCNFEDGSFINLIKLNQPYADGRAFVVVHTTIGGRVPGFMFTNQYKADTKFELLADRHTLKSKVRSRGTVNKGKVEDERYYKLLPANDTWEVLKVFRYGDRMYIGDIAVAVKEFIHQHPDEKADISVWLQNNYKQLTEL